MFSHRSVELWFFVLLVSIFAVLVFFILKPYFPALFLAIIFAVTLRPVYAFLLARFSCRPSATALLTVFLLVLLVIIPASTFGFFLFKDAKTVYHSLTQGGGINSSILQNSIMHIEGIIQRVFPGVSVDVIEVAKQGMNIFVRNLGAVFSAVFIVLLQLFLLLLGVFYFLRDGHRFRNHLVFLSPLSDRYDTTILGKLEVAINSVVRGALAIALIQGILTGIGFAVFQVPSPILWAAVAALAALIPGVGTALVIAPMVLYLFFASGVYPALGLLLWGVLAVGLVDNLLGPILLERGLKIHPFLILLSVLGGLALFGPVGFLAGPVIFAFFFALLDMYPSLFRNEKT